ncbi:DUF4270 domain-containing protein [Chryseobacterium chendengshani]|uniref:DUF4270 family protein n=1 Tax=Chryseobacterium sp. LJ668 TaxID=2864040 RepID=UPI001C69347A|nr:DUF4270 family protein [Chryseobacterium sp. LJ668]MBW8524158.1 DUF4270 domain-containing protein [Chryseobacterium sp. LJ668]QYK17090.1 DUF4270 domain-containing protein [Chryseobacterium sp. LJ668]
MKKAFTILSMVIFGGMLVYNCEPDPDSLGEQLFLDGATEGHEVPYDVIAYNIDNNDSIRSDASKLGLATLGAFTESQFGMQKAAYYTQLRLPAYDPDFGGSAEVDSVVLVIKPLYASDSLTTTTDENYIYPDGSVPAKKIINRYPATKYGRTKLNGGNLTVNVQEVTEFLNGYTDIAYSNKAYLANQLLGSKVFNGYVNSVAITKDSDNSSLFTSDVGFRIPLDPIFFKTKIIDKKGQPELKDVSNFIRYFRGLKISVNDSDGYLVQFSPSTVELIMYYKSLDTGATAKTQKKYAFSVGNGNVHVGNYVYDRSDSALETASTGNPTGDTKLFAQAMGGNSIGIKFPVATIEALKTLYQKNKAAIISAKIRMYTDKDAWKSHLKKPTILTIVQKDIDRKTDPSNPKETTNFTNDLLALVTTPNFAYIKAYDLDKNPAYYDFTVTQSLKDIVESPESGVEYYKDKYFKIDMGNFLQSSTGSTLAGYQFTSRNFSLDRAVFIGSDTGNSDKIQLRVTYGTK